MDCDIMSLGFGVKEGTGLARCRLCNGVIFKGQPAIYAKGYRASGQCHVLPEQCQYLHNRLLEMDVIE
tara:strand:+ start:1537 stop:1740 length:204 start_codon:yes stop_codon:yes gene_type:complete